MDDRKIFCTSPSGFFTIKASAITISTTVPTKLDFPADRFCRPDVGSYDFHNLNLFSFAAL